MNAFEIIIIAVATTGSLLCATAYFRPSSVLSELGRIGSTWFEHPEDRDPALRPPEDAVEEPIPFRPLQGRPR